MNEELERELVALEERERVFCELGLRVGRLERAVVELVALSLLSGSAQARVVGIIRGLDDEQE